MHIQERILSEQGYPSQERILSEQAIPLWNELPKTIREAATLNSFKAGLDKMKLFLT